MVGQKYYGLCFIEKPCERQICDAWARHALTVNPHWIGVGLCNPTNAGVTVKCRLAKVLVLSHMYSNHPAVDATIRISTQSGKLFPHVAKDGAM